MSTAISQDKACQTGWHSVTAFCPPVVRTIGMLVGFLLIIMAPIFYLYADIGATATYCLLGSGAFVFLIFLLLKQKKVLSPINHPSSFHEKKTPIQRVLSGSGSASRHGASEEPLSSHLRPSSSRATTSASRGGGSSTTSLSGQPSSGSSRDSSVGTPDAAPLSASGPARPPGGATEDSRVPAKLPGPLANAQVVRPDNANVAFFE